MQILIHAQYPSHPELLIFLFDFLNGYATRILLLFNL